MEKTKNKKQKQTNEAAITYPISKHLWNCSQVVHTSCNIAHAPGLNIDKNIDNLSAGIMEETLLNIDHISFEGLIYGR